MLIAAGWNRDKTMRRATRNETVLAHDRGFWVDSERAGRERGHRVTGGIMAFTRRIRAVRGRLGDLRGRGFEPTVQREEPNA